MTGVRRWRDENGHQHREVRDAQDRVVRHEESWRDDDGRTHRDVTRHAFRGDGLAEERTTTQEVVVRDGRRLVEESRVVQVFRADPLDPHDPRHATALTEDRFRHVPDGSPPFHRYTRETNEEGTRETTVDLRWGGGAETRTEVERETHGNATEIRRLESDAEGDRRYRELEWRTPLGVERSYQDLTTGAWSSTRIDPDGDSVRETTTGYTREPDGGWRYDQITRERPLDPDAGGLRDVEHVWESGGTRHHTIRDADGTVRPAPDDGGAAREPEYRPPGPDEDTYAGLTTTAHPLDLRAQSTSPDPGGHGVEVHSAQVRGGGVLTVSDHVPSGDVRNCVAIRYEGPPALVADAHFLQFAWVELRVHGEHGSYSAIAKVPVETERGPLMLTTDRSHPSWDLDANGRDALATRPWYDHLGQSTRDNSSLTMFDAPGVPDLRAFTEQVLANPANSAQVGDITSVSLVQHFDTYLVRDHPTRTEVLSHVGWVTDTTIPDWQAAPDHALPATHHVTQPPADATTLAGPHWWALTGEYPSFTDRVPHEPYDGNAPPDVALTNQTQDGHDTVTVWGRVAGQWKHETFTETSPGAFRGDGHNQLAGVPHLVTQDSTGHWHEVRVQTDRTAGQTHIEPATARYGPQYHQETTSPAHPPQWHVDLVNLIEHHPSPHPAPAPHAEADPHEPLRAQLTDTTSHPTQPDPHQPLHTQLTDTTSHPAQPDPHHTQPSDTPNHPIQPDPASIPATPADVPDSAHPSPTTTPDAAPTQSPAQAAPHTVPAGTTHAELADPPLHAELGDPPQSGPASATEPAGTPDSSHAELAERGPIDSHADLAGSPHPDHAEPGGTQHDEPAPTAHNAELAQTGARTVSTDVQPDTSADEDIDY